MFEVFSLNFAYLDPGTGSLIIQSLIGLIAGVSIFGRNAIASISLKAKKLFSRNHDRKSSEAKAE